jgi:flagellar hook-basal body complex protein FliE
MIPLLGAEALSSALANATSAAPSTSATGGGSFLDFVKSAALGAATSLHNAENVAVKGLTGGASAQEVASSLLEAERATLTAVAIRDKVVSAVQDISHMQI